MKKLLTLLLPIVILCGAFAPQGENTSDKVSLKTVENIFVSETYELTHITAGGEVISATPSHPFYVPVKGWVYAAELRAGDVLFSLNGELVTVERVQHEILENPVKVYNFEVSENHTYFVGDSQVGVHNKCANTIEFAHSVTDAVQNGDCFKTFKAIKNLMRKKFPQYAGDDWHHIVEQCQIKPTRAGFAKESINNSGNLVPLSKNIHKQVSSHYSSKFNFTGGKTVRDWLSTQSYEEQYNYGVNFLRGLGVDI